MPPFEGKRVVLGVTGSIAAYKAASLASLLTKAGAQVDVILTEAAERFITPLTFEALTGRPVYGSLWQAPPTADLGAHIAHVGLAHSADLLVIAPCTANTLARLALGLADDLLSVTALAAQCPVLVAPAMDADMFENPATQAHVGALKGRGVHLAGPEVGRMASGLEGLGRLAEPESIYAHCRLLLTRGGPLAGRHVVVSAGPTREPLDPVRYLSNYSSGQQGYAIAQAAADAGARVTLISGPVSLTPPAGCEIIAVEDARAMRDAVLAHACASPPADVLIMAAAVADFRPDQAAQHKIKKTEGAPPVITLTHNPDILLEVAQHPQRPGLVIGFAAESDDLLANAEAKRTRKKLDLIVANDITAPDAGFSAPTNRVVLISTAGTQPLPLLSKAEVAQRILAWAVEHLG